MIQFELCDDPEADAVYGLFADSPEPDQAVLEQVRELASRPGGGETKGVGRRAEEQQEKKKQEEPVLENAAGALKKKLKRIAKRRREDEEFFGDNNHLDGSASPSSSSSLLQRGRGGVAGGRLLGSSVKIGSRPASASNATNNLNVDVDMERASTSGGNETARASRKGDAQINQLEDSGATSTQNDGLPWAVVPVVVTGESSTAISPSAAAASAARKKTPLELAMEARKASGAGPGGKRRKKK
ncbi:unnamed protein product [Amoebophrya sp. A120]|nr:unnamed protein product [Amoebophrya sp. A120]|eukprot:GSA120T00003090001.1